MFGQMRREGGEMRTKTEKEHYVGKPIKTPDGDGKVTDVKLNAKFQPQRFRVELDRPEISIERWYDRVQLPEYARGGA